tara:strand:- start:1040 stop:1393 length:354 start_codon:yes stop_codon:yes gene_type:complete
MKNNIIIIVFIILLVSIGYVVGNFSVKSPVQNNSKLDSLNVILTHRDSIISYKDKQVNILIQSDSIRMNIINKSINQIKNEIKKNSSKTFDVPDSNFQNYIDSLRAKGFYKIQHRGK